MRFLGSVPVAVVAICALSGMGRADSYTRQGIYEGYDPASRDSRREYRRSPRLILRNLTEVPCQVYGFVRDEPLSVAELSDPYFASAYSVVADVYPYGGGNYVELAYSELAQKGLAMVGSRGSSARRHEDPDRAVAHFNPGKWVYVAFDWGGPVTPATWDCGGWCPQIGDVSPVDWCDVVLVIPPTKNRKRVRVRLLDVPPFREPFQQMEPLEVE